MINSREGLLLREREIIRILYILTDKNLDFVIVGGYAIATYKKRFSVDLDIIVKEEDLSKFESILGKEKYHLEYDKDLELVYGEKFKRFGKKIKGFKVNVDLLINGLLSRTTDASWSFSYIKKHSSFRELDNLRFLTPERELLIAMKLHSGRLSDIRDVVALMPYNKEKVIMHCSKGKIEKLKKNIKRLKIFLEKPQFDDSFKGIFGIHVYVKDDVEETKRLINMILRNKNKDKNG